MKAWRVVVVSASRPVTDQSSSCKPDFWCQQVKSAATKADHAPVSRWQVRAPSSIPEDRAAAHRPTAHEPTHPLVPTNPRASTQFPPVSPVPSELPTRLDSPSKPAPSSQQFDSTMKAATILLALAVSASAFTPNRAPSAIRKFRGLTSPLNAKGRSVDRSMGWREAHAYAWWHCTVVVGSVASAIARSAPV